MSSAAVGDLLQASLVHGGSRPLGLEQRWRRERSLGLSVMLQGVVAGLMLAGLAIGPPVIHSRATPVRFEFLSFPVPAPPPRLPPRASRPRPAPPPPLPRARPRPAAPAPASAPAIVVHRLPAVLPRRLPTPPADPVSRPLPAPRPRILTPASLPPQPGRFGDPYGLPPQPALPVPAPLLGAFGAARSAAPADPAPAPLVTTAGFAAARAAGAGTAPAGTIRAAGFAAAADTAGHAGPVGRIEHPGAFAPAAPAVSVVASPPPAANFEPPQILALPTPVYTADAARHRIQGEVVLQVRLGADGQVHILALIRRLGYGLDQSAIAAARKLRFQPARRGGQPVDWTVTLRVRFQLAY